MTLRDTRERLAGGMARGRQYPCPVLRGSGDPFRVLDIGVPESIDA